jgi:hypothetical protein
MKPPRLDGELMRDKASCHDAAVDFGHLVHNTPDAVLRPGSIDDIAAITRWAAEQGMRLTPQGKRPVAHPTSTPCWLPGCRRAGAAARRRAWRRGCGLRCRCASGARPRPRPPWRADTSRLVATNEYAYTCVTRPSNARLSWPWGMVRRLGHRDHTRGRGQRRVRCADAHPARQTRYLLHRTGVLPTATDWCPNNPNHPCWQGIRSSMPRRVVFLSTDSGQTRNGGHPR